MLTGAEDIIVLSRPFSISCTTSHKTCQQLPYNKRHPNIRVPLNARSVGLAGQPGIPPTAAPPEASYRRPEDNIVLSRPPSIPCTTSHKTHRQTLQQKAPLIRGAFWARSMGSARQTGHTPHGRTSATPSPQRMKILTRKYLLGRVAHGSGGHYCFISPIQHIMHYFTQNMPTTPLQQETSHIRMPLDVRSMGSARQTGHTPHSRTSRSFIQKARGQYCFISHA